MKILKLFRGFLKVKECGNKCNNTLITKVYNFSLMNNNFINHLIKTIRKSNPDFVVIHCVINNFEIDNINNLHKHFDDKIDDKTVIDELINLIKYGKPDNNGISVSWNKTVIKYIIKIQNKTHIYVFEINHKKY